MQHYFYLFQSLLTCYLQQTAIISSHYYLQQIANIIKSLTIFTVSENTVLFLFCFNNHFACYFHQTAIITITVLISILSRSQTQKYSTIYQLITIINTFHLQRQQSSTFNSDLHGNNQYRVNAFHLQQLVIIQIKFYLY